MSDRPPVTGSERLSLASAVRRARRTLEEAGTTSPEADAVALAAHTLRRSVAEVRRLMILEERVEGDVLAVYEGLVAQRSARVPLQHLTGTAPFRHLTLRVGPGVFVPRPETEVVAQAAIDEALVCGAAPVVVDLCAGSGAIALAVKDEVPHARVTAVELDPLALGWAGANLETTGLDVELVGGDAASALPGREGSVDVVVSNPPYIPTAMVPVEPEVRDHDPDAALYGGSADGLRIPLAVAGRAAALLRPGGLFVMEHADTQGEALPRRLRGSECWTDIEDHPDLTGRPRYVTARRR
ncbi:MAG: peptide chain release factor N(5)-glutamine methyltransferase [Intrasporangiaceae bacterium]|nr:peptide chain release factor N(5)-glutamine methyltransferase [Intrasporangiaceae bacterium]